MAQTLEIPRRPANYVWSDKDIDTIIDRMVTQESGGNPNARGKKGEIGLLQIMPQTAAAYGVSPELLTNPIVNKWVGRRYLTDLLSKYHGDMMRAVEAYNAGSKRVNENKIPVSTQSYARRALEGLGGAASSIMGEGTAEAEEPYTGPVFSVPAGGKSGTKTTPYTGPVYPSSTAKPEPLGARLAGWLPTVGQGVGEFVGASAGAAIPGVGETGIPEYAGAVAGGAAGSAGGAGLENQIRQRVYGLPPVSVGSETLMGGAGSAVGGVLPLIPRLRKAAAISHATGKSFGEAWEELGRVGADLEGTLGTGARKAELLQQAPGTPVQRAYEQTLNQSLKQLSQAYDTLLKSSYHQMTPNTVTVVAGRVAKTLELAGKPLRQSIEDEIAAQPMTVRRAQVVLSNIRQMERSLNPDTQRVARGAIAEVKKALESDIDAVIGPAKAAQRKALDQMYARKIAQFPIRAERGAFTLPQAAEAVTSTGGKPGDVGRVVSVIEEMEQAGKIDPLRRATATRIFQKASAVGGNNPIEKLKALQKAVASVKPEIFDALYGRGARTTWLRSAADLAERQGELLKHPDEAAAIGAAVGNYLKSPGVLAHWTNFLGHRTGIGAILMLGGAEFGQREAIAGGSALLGISIYEAVSHSKIAVSLLGAAARTKNSQATARLIIAAMNAAIRAGAESALQPTGTGGP